jgi:hypothetical protein
VARTALAKILLLASLASFPGCARSREPATPHDALQAYARALEKGNAKDAYALLSDGAQKSMPFETFERMVKENPEDVKAIARALLRPSGTAQVSATVTAPDGQTLLLRFENGKWRVDRSAIDLYAQDTPEAALATFVRAFENKRYDVLLRFVPDSKREGLDRDKLKTAFEGEQLEEVQRITQAIKAALPTATIERLDDRATMSYGAGGTVELLREHGIWKIEEF